MPLERIAPGDQGGDTSTASTSVASAAASATTDTLGTLRILVTNEDGTNLDHCLDRCLTRLKQ